jgi:YfiH family protein
MNNIVRDGMGLVCFEHLSEHAGLVHAFTTRPFNLAPHRGEDREQALENRRRLCRALGLDFERLTGASQIHGPDVLMVEEADIGRGRDGRPGAVPLVDGLITDRPGVPLLSMSADCATLLAFDPGRRAVGAAHASWRGTVGGIAANVVAQMGRCFGCRPEDLLVGIGPSAGPCCYEVKEDVRRVAATRIDGVDRLVPRRYGRFWFDLWATLEEQLAGAGVPRGQIEQSRVCTMCDERFYSHRRDGAECGRFGLICALRSSA